MRTKSIIGFSIVMICMTVCKACLAGLEVSTSTRKPRTHTLLWLGGVAVLVLLVLAGR